MEHLSSKQTPISKTRKISIQERSVLVGNFIVINGYRANLTLLKQRFAEGSYQLDETPHFLLFTRTQAPSMQLVHKFAPDAINATIGDYLLRELKPLGVLTTEQQFSNLFGAVIFSLSPYDIQGALRLYGRNTLKCYQQLLYHPPDASSPPHGTINAFARLYNQISQLLVGESFLDVGCSFGLLPLLIAQHYPTMFRVVGVDIRPEPFPVVESIAQELRLQNVAFTQADVLSSDFEKVGTFDTVVALHFLEHFSEADMYCALLNMWKVTAHRLILAVPYEEKEPETIYGHKQLFTPATFQALGEWCRKHLLDVEKIDYEACVDGLLLLQKKSFC